jgi:hypothetical protein
MDFGFDPRHGVVGGAERGGHEPEALLAGVITMTDP